MTEQLSTQAIVISQEALDPGETSEKIALFKEDGTPFTGGGGGAEGVVSIDTDTNNTDPSYELSGYIPQPGDRYILCDTSGGDVNVYLPDTTEGAIYTLIKTTDDEYGISARANSDFYLPPEFTDPVGPAMFTHGQSSAGSNIPYCSITVICDGTNWAVAGIGLVLSNGATRDQDGWYDLSLDSYYGAVSLRKTQVKTVTADSMINVLGQAHLILADATDDPLTVRLLSGIAAGYVGAESTIKKIDASANVVTVTVADGASLDGVLDGTFELSTEGESVKLVDAGDGNIWTV